MLSVDQKHPIFLHEFEIVYIANESRIDNSFALGVGIMNDQCFLIFCFGDDKIQT